MKAIKWESVKVKQQPWLKTRFGDHYCQISVDTTLKLRSSAKDVARALHKIVPPEIDRLTSKFVNAPQGVTDRDHVFGHQANEDWVPGSVETDAALMEYIKQYPKEWNIVQKMLGIPRQKSRHACAFVIADKPIHEFIPTTFVGGVKCTQYTPSSVEAAGGLKMDFLVINSLNDIGNALALVQRRSGIDIPMETLIDGRRVPKHRLLPLTNGELADIWGLPEDQGVFRDVCEGRTETVFQFNTPSAVKWLKNFNYWKNKEEGRKAIDSIEAMAAFTALDRPGPLDAYVEGSDGRQHNMLVEYARRARNEIPAQSNPHFDQLFPETYGILTYQEQLQKAYQTLTGCSGPEAEEFRTNVAKKKQDKILKAYPKWMERVGPNLGEEAAKDVWDTFVTWGQYGFNKSMLQTTILVSGKGERKRLMDFTAGDTVRCVDEYGEELLTEVVALHDHGEMMGWEVEFADGHKVVVSSHHKFLTPEGQRPLHEIVDRNLEVLSGVSMEKAHRRSADSVRAEGAQKGASRAQEGLCGLCRCEERERPATHGQAQYSARAESGGVDCCNQNICSARHPACEGGKDARLAGGTPRGNPSDLGISSSGGQEVEDGGMASVYRSPDLGGRSCSLRKQTEAGGLCVSGSQDLGGSGRVLPLLRGVQNGQPARDGSVTGRDAEGRGPSTGGCDVDPAFRAMLPFFRRSDEARMAPVAYSDAPLSSTGSLVRRRVVRVRSVGLVRMCDLEVAHPKHNFLLPNGVVTSNSHSVCYVHIAYACAFLKHHYPLEWWSAVLTNASKNEVSDKFWVHCAKFMRLPDVNRSGDDFFITGDGAIQAPVSLINGIGENALKELVRYRPYDSIQELCFKLEQASIDNKEPIMDKKTGQQKILKNGKLSWRKKTSALKRNVVHKLIAAGAMDSLFSDDMGIEDKIFAFEKAISAARGETKVEAVPAQYLTYSPARAFQIRKDVFSSFSADLRPFLLEGTGWPSEAISEDGNYFRYCNSSLPIVSGVKMDLINTTRPWPDDFRVTVAVPVYVRSQSFFKYGPEKENEACKLMLDMDGVPREFVRWPDRKTKKVPPAMKNPLTGAIGLAICSKYTEGRDFGLDDLVIFHTPIEVANGKDKDE